MDFSSIRSVYFIGIGGIGMSAIARYFLCKGISVGGYDRIESELTEKLRYEGVWIHYEDCVETIPDNFKKKTETLVVYTPAIPEDHAELCFFKEQGFEVEKRAQVLGTLTRAGKGLCVAGTHGKTTTSSMVAHILHESHVGCNAFLGGITKNYGTNYILSDNSDYIVVEADEFDRSFHWLTPYASVITATDADHLDIYGTKEAYLESFRKYTSLIRNDGYLIIHEGLELQPAVRGGVTIYTYGQVTGDFHAENIRIGNGEIIFDFVSPLGSVKDIQLGVPVSINIENGLAAMALAQISGVTSEEMRKAMATFMGVDRRFDFKLKTSEVALLVDYAHHPAEIFQSVKSIKELYSSKRIMAIFQPHLYTRTRDFYKDFAESLSLLDEVALVDIYPAREKPIPGVSSRLIYDRLAPGVKKVLCHKEEIPDVVKASDADVFIILGAGDIDVYASVIADILKKRC